MRKEQLEEIIRMASAIANRKQFILFGSQWVYAVTSRPPVEVLISRECDVWLGHEPQLQPLLARELGKESEYQKSKVFISISSRQIFPSFHPAGRSGS